MIKGHDPIWLIFMASQLAPPNLIAGPMETHSFPLIGPEIAGLISGSWNHQLGIYLRTGPSFKSRMLESWPRSTCFKLQGSAQRVDTERLGVGGKWLVFWGYLCGRCFEFFLVFWCLCGIAWNNQSKQAVCLFLKEMQDEGHNHGWYHMEPSNRSCHFRWSV